MLVINQPISSAINAEDLQIKIISHKILEILNTYINDSFFDEDLNFIGTLTIINTRIFIGNNNQIDAYLIPHIIDLCCFNHLKEKLEKYIPLSNIISVKRSMFHIFSEEDPIITFTFRGRKYTYYWIKKYIEVDE